MRNVFFGQRPFLAGAASVFLAATSVPVHAEGPPEGFWITGDKNIVVATGACKKGSPMLCGIIVAVPGAARDAELARYNLQLCRLPVIWDLNWSPEAGQWDNGKILDPETEKVYDLSASFEGKALQLVVSEGKNRQSQSLIWQSVGTFDEVCP